MSKISFYQSVIGVLSALVLGFVVQSLAASKSEKPVDEFSARVHMMASLFMIGLLSIGGLVAFRNIYTGQEGKYDLVSVTILMTIGLVSLCLVMIDTFLGRPKVFSRLTYLVYIIVLIMAALFSYLAVS